MGKHIVNTMFAPAAIGPYSQGVAAHGFIFTSGQVPLVPGSSQLAEGGIQGQTRQALENLKAILEASGSSLEKVVKTTVFLQNMADFAAMNAIYSEYFPAQPPARSTIQVAALPLGALVEIEAVALAE
ncbi:MAG: RidA family protein [Anaerolineae bacterium]|nr:RidA family protein [Anaerolineae bacterium]MDW8173543.1 RidA family protein [Anaerolineae bacterium]